MWPANSASSAEAVPPRPQRGLVESTQWALLIPVLLGVLFTIVQAGIWLSGRSTVQQAAMAGAEHAAFVASDPAAAEQVASRLANDAGLRAVDVRVAADGELVSVTVSAEVPAILPTGLAHVSATAERIREP